MIVRGEPSPLRWLIGVELARYRKAAKLTHSQVSGPANISMAKVGHMETGRLHQDPEEVARLLEIYGASQRDIDRLTSLAGRADEATWWAPWAQVVPDWLRTFVGLEALAEREFVFEPLAIPGLLQTQDYALRITAGTPRVRPDHDERFVEFRIARASRLTDTERPLDLETVITEAGLQLAVGTEEIRRAQLEHLIAMAELPNITIQVVRPNDGVHTALVGHFVVLDFAEVRSIGYTELHDGAVYIQDPDQVRSYTMSSRNVQAVALDPDKSVEYIKSLIRP